MREKPSIGIFRDPRTPVVTGPTCTQERPGIFARRGTVNYPLCWAETFMMLDGYTPIPSVAFLDGNARQVRVCPDPPSDVEIFLTSGPGKSLKCERVACG